MCITTFFPVKPQKMIKYISCAGGGTRGIMYLGCMSALETNDAFMSSLETVQGFSGCSIGALFCLALYLGMTSSQMIQIISPMMCSFDNVAPQLDISLLITNYGLDDGESMRKAIKNILNTAGFSPDISLSALQQFIKKEFVCVTTNLQTKSPVYLSAQTHPHLSVANAVFMSMCVPFLFAPFEYNGELFVDGGLSMNLPQYYASQDTLCLQISDTAPKQERISNWQQYLYSVMSCGIECQTLTASMYIDPMKCIILKTPNALVNGPLDRHLTQSAVKQYMRYGYLAGITYLFPQLIDAMDMLLAFLIASRVKVYESSCAFDEHL